MDLPLQAHELQPALAVSHVLVLALWLPLGAWHVARRATAPAFLAPLTRFFLCLGLCLYLCLSRRFCLCSCACVLVLVFLCLCSCACVLVLVFLCLCSCAYVLVLVFLCLWVQIEMYNRLVEKTGSEGEEEARAACAAAREASEREATAETDEAEGRGSQRHSSPRYAPASSAPPPAWGHSSHATVE